MQADLGQVCAADLTDNRQAQASALGATSIKAFEHSFALIFRNAGAVVLDFQHSRRIDAQNHIATLGCMGQSVVHQVAKQLVE
ncbi:hypothetical protein D3C84_1032510 [compost metagenome]